jgi:hypothetical protein
MKNFLLGVVVGSAATLWYTQTRGRLDVDRQFGQMQERAHAVLNESRRILEETRQELASALEAGRHTVQQKTEKLRNPSASGEASQLSGESIPPTA